MKQRIKLHPSSRLRRLVQQQGVSWSGKLWGIKDSSMRRFFVRGGGISGNTVAAIIRGTGWAFSSLFKIARHD